jgi:hypothetical protein
MWRELVSKHDDSASFATAATSFELAQAAESLGVPFPESLRSVLLESNGIEGEYGLGLLWPVSRIVSDNLSFRNNPDFRELYMPFDCLLFFADAGNGDQFGFVILDGEVRRDDIFAWNHEDDSRSWIAPHLEAYFDWWMSGRITV